MTSSSATSSYEDVSVNESQMAGPNVGDEEEEIMEEEVEEDENVEVNNGKSSEIKMNLFLRSKTIHRQHHRQLTRILVMQWLHSFILLEMTHFPM